MTEHADSPHLDDDALSAVLDGEATAAESQHADACPACAARLGALREASMLVRTPIDPPPDAQRDAAVAAALGAFGAGEVVPLRRRRVAPPVWLAAAAAAVVVAAAVALIPRGGDDTDQVAGGDDTAQFESEAGPTADADTMMAAAAPLDAGELGPLDGVDLRQTVADQLDAAAARGATGSGPVAGNGGDAVEASVAVPCDDTVRAGNELLGPLVLHGTGTYEDDPVVLLVYDVFTDDGVDRWVYVLGVDGCVIRNQQTFAA